MLVRILLLGLALAPVRAWPQSAECLKLAIRLQAFDAKYSLYRFGGPKATLATVEEEFGTPALELGTDPGMREAVYTLPGCTGRVLINAEGAAWMAKFAAAPLPQPPGLDSLEQLLEVEDRITEQKVRLEKLEGTKAELIRQAAELTPAPLPAGECRRVLETAPDNAEDYLRRGWCQHAAGRLDDAIREYGASIRLAPLPLALQNRALAYLAQGQSALALADLARLRDLEKERAAKLGEDSGEGKDGRIKVKGYTRSDGTYVAPYTRLAPGKK
ncbi:MAG: hypothetical protein ABI759_09965 [Candidatus Solibacter sp.]